MSLGRWGKVRVAPPTSWNRIVSAFTSPFLETWESVPPIDWSEVLREYPILWFADDAYIFADTPEKVQHRCRGLVDAAAEYGIRSAPPLRRPGTAEAESATSRWQTAAASRTVPRSMS